MESMNSRATYNKRVENKTITSSRCILFWKETLSMEKKQCIKIREGKIKDILNNVYKTIYLCYTNSLFWKGNTINEKKNHV